MSEVNSQKERRNFLVGLVAGTGALAVATAASDPGPSSMANAMNFGCELSEEERAKIAEENISLLKRGPVVDSVLERLYIARKNVPQDGEGKKIMLQIDNIINTIVAGNKLFANIDVACW